MAKKDKVTNIADAKKKKRQVEEEDFDVEDLDIEDDEPPKKSKKSKDKGKDAKPADKKASSKAGVTPKHMQVPDNMVTVAMLEEEYGKDGKTIRTVLRNNEFEKPEGMGRWAWKKSDPDLKRLRNLLSGKGGAAKEEAAPAKDKKKSKK